jgi:signal transduction histidine kinase
MLNNFTEPVPLNEKERITNLAEFDIDYSNIESNFKDLAHLAATIAGTEISLVNLIDSVTQWTVSNHGLDLTQMPREESVCQYTIANEGPFEVLDLSKDDRFSQRFYVKGPLDLKYYLGIPLSTSEGINIGALCVLDTQMKPLSQEKIEMLQIIASEIVNRLKAMKAINQLKQQVVKAKEIQKKVGHNIRGPVAGIIGLTGLIIQQGPNNDLDEVLECISLVQQSGKSILEVADEILYGENVEPVKVEEFNLQLFKEKLEHLYNQQATDKNITLEIHVNERNRQIPFLKNKLLQITGNLVSHALRCTRPGGWIKVDLDLTVEATNNILKIKVQDSAEFSDHKDPDVVLSMVKQLVESLDGTFKLLSDPEKGSMIETLIPQHYLPHVSFDDTL